MARAALIFVSCLIVFVAIFISYAGYGNSLKEVVSGNRENIGYEDAFYVARCNTDGRCELAEEHKKVLQFDFPYRFPGAVKGKGGNPITVLRDAGFKFLPFPDDAIAALKWCTSGQIWRPPAHDVRIFITPLGKDPIGTARCVQSYTSRSFNVYVADPVGTDANSEPFEELVQ